MSNDISISVSVSNDTGTGIAAVNTSLQTLKTKANEAGNKLESLATKAGLAAAALEALKVAADGAGDSLRDLRHRAEAAGNSMRDLRDGTTGTNNSLRTLNTRTQTANTRLDDLSTRTRTLRSDTDDLDGSMRRLTGTLGGMRRGGSLGTFGSSSGGGMERLKAAAISLAPALIPVAASLVPIAANAAAAGVALGAFGVAAAGQVAAVAKAAEAEKKYQDAIKQHGRSSTQATQAEAEFLRQVRDMDPATRRAAAAFSVLKDQYQGWSKSLAGDTMPVATKSMAIFGALLPKLTPLVRGTSTELNRLMTVLAGGVASPGFDRFMQSFSQFASGALAKATTGLVHFSQAMSGGAGSSQFTEFMAYVHRVGPAVGETLGNLTRAVIHLVAAGSEAGVGMLQLVNALAKIVNAVPTGALSNLIQLYAGLKLLKLGMAAVSAVAGAGAIARIGAYFQVMRAAGVGTTLRATAASLTTIQKVGAAAGVLGAVALGINALAEKARGAPPDVDRLATSLKTLASTGKFSGELKATFGDMDGFVARVAKLRAESSAMEKVKPLVAFSGLGAFADTAATKIDDLLRGTRSMGATKDDLKAFDESLASLVKGGHADIAASQFRKFEEALKRAGVSTKDINSTFSKYKAAVTDLKAEQELAARGMGLFGEQAVAVQEKLNAQKASADGLRQSIEALNDANRASLGGMIGFEASIDAAAKAAQGNHGALKMVNGQLDLNSPKAQAAATALNDLAAKTKDAATSARESGASWESVNAIYERGRGQFLKTARAMGLSRSEAKQLAASIMQIPSSKSTQIKMRTEDAVAGLNSVIAAIRKTPDSKFVTVKSLTADAISGLRDVGFRVTRLKDGSFRVTAKTGSAVSNLAAVLRLRNGIRNKSVTFVVTTHYRITGSGAAQVAAGRGGHQFAGMAHGGRVRGYASGGDVQAFPGGGYVNGPGSGTSDSILAMFGSGARGRVSNTEYVMQSSAVQHYGVKLFDLLNAGKLKLAAFARGGPTKAERAARSAAHGDLTISHFGQMAGYHHAEIRNALAQPDSLGPLVSALNQWRGVILKSTHGGQERGLLRMLDRYGAGLIRQEKSLNKVNNELEKAKTKLSDLKSAASQLAGAVKSGVLGSANITRGAQGEGPVTVGTIMRGLTQSRDKASSFAGALKRLKARGLSKSLIQQIGEAGIEGGGLETAGALMGASKSELASINKLQSQISSSASSAGKTTANAVFGAQIKAADRLVDGLKKQQAKLEKAMDKLAAAIERAIRRAIGHKAAGGIIGAASGGARGGLTWVGEQGPELARLPYGSRVYSAPDSRRMAAQGGGRPAHAVLEIHSGGSRLDDVLVEILRKAVRVKGGDVQLVLGTG